MKNKYSFTLEELASKVGAKLQGDSSVIINRAAPIEKAGTGDISFVANKAYQKHIPTTKASALVLDNETECTEIPSLRSENPYLTFAHIIDILYPTERKVPVGIDKSAVVNPDATIGDDAGVGPLCHIEGKSEIGANTQLLSSVFIDNDVVIGKDCMIYPGVRILNGSRIGNGVIIHSGVVIGSDGFGFAESPDGLKKIKQIGWVEISDLVEVGANSTIDRGALGPTKIGFGTKIDNLVQIAHNVEIGSHCIIVAQVGISGSTKVGNGVIMGGQAGLAGHLNIGDGVKISAQSGVSKSIPAGTIVRGTPAREIKRASRVLAAQSGLPELIKRVRELEKKNKD